MFSTKISTATICVVFLSFTNMVTGGIRSLHSSGFNCRKGGETKHIFGIFSPQVCICVICSDRTATFALTRHTWHRAMPMCTLFSLHWSWELPQQAPGNLIRASENAASLETKSCSRTARTQSQFRRNLMAMAVHESPTTSKGIPTLQAFDWR